MRTRENAAAAFTWMWMLAAIGGLLGCAGCTLSHRSHVIAGPAPARPYMVALPDGASMMLRYLQPGTFLMGSFDDEAGHQPDESPVHEVTLTHGFWFGATEVTIGQWRVVMGTTLRGHVAAWLRDEMEHDFPSGRATVAAYMGMDPTAEPETFLANEDDSLPMYFVSWHDAMAFCVRLTQRERAANHIPDGWRFTLPTEAQWEYACRAGSTTPTYAGDLTTVANIAWFSGNSADGYAGKSLPGAQAGPRTVRQKQPNIWGLHDLSGNVWEWCLDWYDPYTRSANVDPEGPIAGETRVNRGGSWGSGANDERSASRAGNPPAEASAYRGFRVVLLPGPLQVTPRARILGSVRGQPAIQSSSEDGSGANE